MVKDLNAGVGNSTPSELTASGDLLYFHATTSNGTETFVSDGTGAGTFPIAAGRLDSPIEIGNQLFFILSDATHGRNYGPATAPRREPA